MPRLLVIREWWDHSLKLGGVGVTIVRAWFGVKQDPTCSLDVTEQLSQRLEREGSVWLQASTCCFDDPAPGSQKQLVVIFDGENECSGESAAWSALELSMRCLSLKAVLQGALAAQFGLATATTALGMAPPMGVLVLTAAASGARGWKVRCRSAGDITVYTDGSCSICLQPLTSDMCVLDCGHCFHRRCAGDWAAHLFGHPRCPTCTRTSVRNVFHPRIIPDACLEVAPVTATMLERFTTAAHHAQGLAEAFRGGVTFLEDVPEPAQPAEVGQDAAEWAWFLLWA